jgi:hypothetical protein
MWGMRFARWPMFLAGCAATQTANPTLVTMAAPSPTSVPGLVDKPPSPIAGVWRVPCPENQGELIEFTVRGTQAVGTVVDPGASVKYGFHRGEEIFRLKLDDGHGDWLGQVHWRGVSGAEHWDSIRFSATATMLDATMTNEPCYRSMPRAR